MPTSKDSKITGRPGSQTVHVQGYDIPVNESLSPKSSVTVNMGGATGPVQTFKFPVVLDPDPSSGIKGADEK